MLIHDGILLQLITCKFITEEDVMSFIKAQRISLDDHITVVSLLEKGRITDEQIAQCMALRMKIGYVNLRFVIPCIHDITLIATDVANFLRIIPFRNGMGELYVAMEDPTHESRLEIIHHFMDEQGKNSPTKIAISTTSGMKYALRKFYPIHGHERLPKTIVPKQKNATEKLQPVFTFN